MKIIILGDIHANLPALERCVREARREGFDRILHSGDLVGYGPFPEEVVRYLSHEGIQGVRGNWDENVAWLRESPGPIHPWQKRSEVAAESFSWTLSRVSATTRGILGNLPFEIRFREGGITFSLLHANPLDASTYLYENADDLTFREYAKAAGVDVILFDHTHRHFHRQVAAHHFVSVGSVGLPVEGDPRTGYAVIYTGNIGKGLDVNFRRLEYDTQAVISRSRQLGLPDTFEPFLSQTA